jgi:hypothetical protein
MTGALIQIIGGRISLLDRPSSLPPTLLEVKRFVAGYGDFGGEEGASLDTARIELVSVPQPAVAGSRVIGVVNGDGFTLGMVPSCYVGKNLIFGPMLIYGQTDSGQERVLTHDEARAFHLVWGDREYPELGLRAA